MDQFSFYSNSGYSVHVQVHRGVSLLSIHNFRCVIHILSSTHARELSKALLQWPTKKAITLFAAAWLFALLTLLPSLMDIDCIPLSGLPLVKCGL